MRARGSRRSSGRPRGRARPWLSPAAAVTAIRTVKVVSDLPLLGGESVQSAQMEWAIGHVINERYGGKAGDFTIEYKSNDNATEAAGRWAASKCVDNAHSYASDNLVVGVIGPVNSGCAEYEIPILNRGETSCDGQPVGHRCRSPPRAFAALSRVSPSGTTRPAGGTSSGWSPRTITGARARRELHEEGARGHEGVRPGRQGVVREGRRRRLQGQRQKDRPQGRRS